MFKGSMVAIVTPFKDGGVDYSKLKELVDHQIENGTSAIIPCGTTGESPTLTTKEHEKVIEVCVEAAKKRGVEVKNVSGYSSDSVIQHTFSMLFYLVGHSRYYDEYVKEGSYAKSPIFTDVSHPFFEIKGKRWGIIGLGEIGRGVARVAEAFGAEVSYFSTSGNNHDQNYPHIELDELLKTCHIISIHAPLNERTKDLLGYEQLLMCRDSAVVLNLGRGGIIDEAAVAKIIDEKNISFGLDVLGREPMEHSHPLLNVKNKNNLYITPHIAWTSIEARDKLIAGVIENIISFTSR